MTYPKKFSGNLETGNRGLDTRGEHSGKEDCRVRVNVDLVSPSATLVAKSGNDVVLNSIKVNDGKTFIQICPINAKVTIEGENKTTEE